MGLSRRQFIKAAGATSILTGAPGPVSLLAPAAAPAAAPVAAAAATVPANPLYITEMVGKIFDGFNLGWDQGIEIGDMFAYENAIPPAIDAHKCVYKLTETSEMLEDMRELPDSLRGAQLDLAARHMLEDVARKVSSLHLLLAQSDENLATVAYHAEFLEALGRCEPALHQRGFAPSKDSIRREICNLTSQLLDIFDGLAPLRLSEDERGLRGLDYLNHILRLENSYQLSFTPVNEEDCEDKKNSYYCMAYDDMAEKDGAIPLPVLDPVDTTHIAAQLIGYFKSAYWDHLDYKILRAYPPTYPTHPFTEDELIELFEKTPFMDNSLEDKSLRLYNTTDWKKAIFGNSGTPDLTLTRMLMGTLDSYNRPRSMILETAQHANGTDMMMRLLPGMKPAVELFLKPLQDAGIATLSALGPDRPNDYQLRLTAETTEALQMVGEVIPGLREYLRTLNQEEMLRTLNTEASATQQPTAPPPSLGAAPQ